MLRLLIVAAVLPLTLCACQAEGEPGATEPNRVAAGQMSDSPVPSHPGETSTPGPDECGADKLARWLNILPTEPVKTEIRDAIGHDRIRYIGPGNAVTLDRRLDRLNIETGTDGRIKGFRCG